MHIHELNPKKTLIVVVAFTILLLAGFLTMHKPLLNYNLDMSQSIEMLKDSTVYFYPEQLSQALNNSEKDIVLIDLRNNFDFGQGHIPGAENVSAFELTKKENIERLNNLKEQNVTVVFYGEDQLQANGPWMLFRQLGFDNIKLLLGGYAYFKESNNIANDSAQSRDYILGSPKFDFAAIFENIQPDSGQFQTKKSEVNIVRRKKTTAVSGGC